MALQKAQLPRGGTPLWREAHRGVAFSWSGPSLLALPLRRYSRSSSVTGGTWKHS